MDFWMEKHQSALCTGDTGIKQILILRQQTHITLNFNEFLLCDLRVVTDVLHSPCWTLLSV